MVKPIIVDKLSDDLWATDESGEWTESEEEEEEKEEKELKIKRVDSRPKLLKNVVNYKSAANLKQVK